jgi:hypothetical protein
MCHAARGPAWRSPKHRRQWRTTLDQYVMPAIGEMPQRRLYRLLRESGRADQVLRRRQQKPRATVIPKVSQGKFTEAVDALRRTALGDAGESAGEARRRARAVAPHGIEFLSFVIRDDQASTPQRVRASAVLLEVAGLLQTEPRVTDLFGESAGDSDVGHNGREAG